MQMMKRVQLSRAIFMLRPWTDAIVSGANDRVGGEWFGVQLVEDRRPHGPCSSHDKGQNDEGDEKEFTLCANHRAPYVRDHLSTLLTDSGVVGAPGKSVSA